ncbi:gluconolactonase [Rhizobiaceae bacterium CRRU44]|uniref:Gluconolactonase n=1 Tax=Ferranicluibacter rubi TaxID=2715133 RepID=A0AA43ZHR8_9HYPH|nr:gluconolactonase [Ferranicluibacter rubi]
MVTSTSSRFGLSAQTALPTILAIAFAATLTSTGPSLAQSSTVETIKSETRKLIAPITSKTDERLEEVAKFDHQVTGVTVSEDNRIFVNFPRWSEDVPVSVAEVMRDGTIKPYPNDEWNAWRNARMSEVTPGDHFVSVQSVVADGKGSLWVVDPAAPNTEKTVKDGPKLVQIDLKTNSVKKVYPFAADVAGPASYMNDVRLSPDGKFAYLTDSGVPGGLVVVDLNAGKAWRVLSDDATTQMEKDAVVMTDGKPLKRPDGRQPMFNADGLALSNDGATLYWQAVTAKTMYRIDASLLQQAGTNPDAAKGKAEKFATTEPVDGLWTGKDDSIYLSAVGADAVKLLKQDGKIETVLTDSRLRWPDTFSQGPDGFIYVTASHIQDSPWFHPSGWANKDFTLFRFRPE